MTVVSIELVPRSIESIDADLQLVREVFASVRMVNIPDLLRFELRSWQACTRARRVLPRAVPHLRAMDFDAADLVALKELLSESDLPEVLVVQGDPPQDLARRVYPTKSVELIQNIKRVLPELKVYAVFDPYRGAFRRELEYAQAKLEAGADGFFTQPFFDLRLMDVCADLLAGQEVWWGVTPVVSARTRRYWETKNGAIFPAGFEPTLAWNRRFAADCLAWVRERDANTYFMPIRTGLVEYLDGIL